MLVGCSCFSHIPQCQEGHVWFSKTTVLGGSLSIAAFVVIYKRRKYTAETTTAEELLNWKEKHKSKNELIGDSSSSNPMYNMVSSDKTKVVDGSPPPGKCVVKIARNACDLRVCITYVQL